MIKQMLKANEVRIRSMEKETQQMRVKLEKSQSEGKQLKEGVKNLVEELKTRNVEQVKIIEILGEAGDAIGLENLFDIAESFDTEEELKISITESLRQMAKEESQLNKEKNPNENEEDEKDSLSNEHLTVGTPKKVLISQLEKEKEKSKYKLQLEEEIEKNIQSRSRVKGIKEQRRSIVKMTDSKNEKRERGFSEGGSKAGQLEEDDKEKFYMKCRILDEKVFKQEEKEEIELMIKTMASIDEFCLWVWGSLEQKCMTLQAKNKEIEIAKSIQCFIK
jgi:hypothetical protein